MMKRLLGQVGADRQPNLFFTEEQLMNEAYVARERLIAYSNEESAGEAREV